MVVTRAPLPCNAPDERKSGPRRRRSSRGSVCRAGEKNLPTQLPSNRLGANELPVCSSVGSAVVCRLLVGPPGIPTKSSSWSNQSRPTVTYPLAPTGARTAGGSWSCHSRTASRPAQAARAPRSRCCVGNSASMPGIRAATSRARRSGPGVTENHLERFGSWATGSKRWSPSAQARRERHGSSLGQFERWRVSFAQTQRSAHSELGGSLGPRARSTAYRARATRRDGIELQARIGIVGMFRDGPLTPAG